MSPSCSHTQVLSPNAFALPPCLTHFDRMHPAVMGRLGGTPNCSSTESLVCDPAEYNRPDENKRKRLQKNTLIEKGIKRKMLLSSVVN